MPPMAALSQQWTGWRGWARDWAFATAVGLCLGLIGPFATYLSPLPFRLVYWTALLWAGMTFYGLAIRVAVGRRPRPRSSRRLAGGVQPHRVGPDERAVVGRRLALLAIPQSDERVGVVRPVRGALAAAGDDLGRSEPADGALRAPLTRAGRRRAAARDPPPTPDP